jgi:hypothetical protein
MLSFQKLTSQIYVDQVELEIIGAFGFLFLGILALVAVRGRKV